MHLTDKSVAALACPPGRKDMLIFDDAMAGFAVRVTAGGGKAWLAQWTAVGLRRRLPLGDWPAVTAAAARKAAGAVRAKVAAGGDPFAEREAARQAVRAQVEADKLTVGVLFADWLRLTAHRPHTVTDATGRLKLAFRDWADRPAAAVTKGDVVRRLDRIAAERGVVTARRTLAYGRAAFNWACKRDLLAANPFAGVAAPGKETARDRALSDREIGEVWRAAGTLAPEWTAFVRLLLLTLQRREEVAGMQWPELDSRVRPTKWTIPAARAKNGRQHHVHLSEPVRAILTTLTPRDDTPSVLHSGRGAALTTFSAAKAALDAAIAAERGEAGNSEPMSPWKFHDLRRTGVSTLARMGTAPHVADRLLNHVTGAIQGVAAVYQRHDFATERAAALDAWASHVEACGEGREAAENVIALRRANAARSL